MSSVSESRSPLLRANRLAVLTADRAVVVRPRLVRVVMSHPDAGIEIVTAPIAVNTFPHSEVSVPRVFEGSRIYPSLNSPHESDEKDEDAQRDRDADDHSSPHRCGYQPKARAMRSMHTPSATAGSEGSLARPARYSKTSRIVKYSCHLSCRL